MSQAFVFDLDGVLVDSESVWRRRDAAFFGPQVNERIKDQILGSSLQRVYKLAVAQGFVMAEAEFYRRYNALAASVYDEAAVTDGAEQLIETLQSLGFTIGLVSASPQAWIDQVLQKLEKRAAFSYILSISDSPGLASKPAPDSYVRAIKALGATPPETIILEDSNNGIAAAKASGALVIGLREHLEPTYAVTGADRYVENLLELQQYLRGRQS